MSKFSLFIIAALALITVTGAGCSLPGMTKKTSDTTKFGGVYKTSDAGLGWTQKTAFPTSQGVGNIGTASIKSMAIDPQDHKTIYLGTSENGLLVSYNGAETWQAANDSKMQSGLVSSVAVDYKDMCSLYTAVGQKVYVSENCGRTFEESYNETRSGIKVNKIITDWYNQGTVYIGLTNGDVLKSSDFGKSWSRIKSFGKVINAFLISNQDSRVVLVGTEDGFWKSTDAGLNWTEKSSVLKDFSQAKEVYDLVQNSSGLTVIMSNRYGLLRSTDLGETWEALVLLTPAKQVVITALALDPKDANIIYYTTTSTLYKTVNGGLNWTTQKLVTGWEAAHLLVDPEEPSNLYLGYQILEK
ncbi:MAG: Glycosyl hydrolase [Candidatus Uhrbacteria bacterium GW2011_GWE2_45_35]|uniref:Glycosyl hydrolase n=1 Tax=Candidatus Uhrbacteria bacterium GW2011_GWE2_45_35 TaxID=1618993 RepID=A0A0G1MBI0_9BACT|nr:MAG: Glycosyl hydrolase [Candidatus Uhrbacteria bacterium GW2011_GWE2_45_35]HBR80257.1 hypothetical protein [Candidatus Uhrbacteria bacterium]HCU31762.1 hypothetical protein [Candidatus Uhrbacteria bacterium]